MSEGAGAPWWRSYFDDVFYDLHLPLFPEADSRREAAAMVEMLGLPEGARILDVPCGWGRHTLLFPDIGIDAFGADLSVALLQRAVDQAREEATPLRFAAADLRELPFRDAAFDAVLNVFTSLGLFVDDEEDLRALREARRILRPGGKLLLESMHRDDVICAYAERDQWSLPDGTRVRVRRRFDAVAGISYERLQWKRGDEGGEKRHALRLRTATEIAGLLRRAGFGEVTYYGGWDLEPFRHDSQQVIAVAERD